MNTDFALRVDTWETMLNHRLPQFGHRNWVVVADAAYPAQSNPAIETIATEADHVEVLVKALNAIAGCKHIRANVLLDAELKWVAEEDSPGVAALRQQLHRLIAPRNVRELAHEQIIAKLDRSARLFRILILKSTLTIPYTSVFLELDCGYWNSDSERRLRDSVKNVSTVTDVSKLTDRRTKSPRFSGPFSSSHSS